MMQFFGDLPVMGIFGQKVYAGRGTDSDIEMFEYITALHGFILVIL
jgi:hypothetical protein